MRLVRITARKFFTWADVDVEFPAEGIVLLVGENGAGKTSLGIEALPWALWGETVRGSDPVPDGDVEVTTRGRAGEEVAVHRVREGRRASALQLSVARGDVSGQTATETQAKIDREFGDWRLFCNTRVFSRNLLSRFGSATNKDRQRLLESILGLEQFSRAEKVCRQVRATREGGAQAAARDLAAAEAGLTRSRQALQGASEAGRAPGAIETEIAPLARALEAARARERAAHQAYDKATAAQRAILDAVQRTLSGSCQPRTQEADRLAAEAQRLRSRAKGADGLKDCPVCLRAVGEGDREAVRRHYEEEAEPMEIRAAALRAEVDVLAADLAEQREDAAAQGKAAARADAERREALVEVGAHEEHVRRLERELAAAQGREADRARVQAMVDADERAVNAASLTAVKAQRSLAEADAALEVLGPRGARVALFAAALARLQAETNRVLARLGLALRVRLSGKKTQASGAVVDEVSMEVEGAGAGKYSGASDGEKTRVDVAMILGLSRMAGGEGLLLFDEIFDPLDDDGIERVAELLGEMAKDRQIVVTTHADRLAALIPAGSTWRIEKVGGASRIAGT